MTSRIAFFVVLIICSLFVMPTADAGIGRAAPAETFSKEEYKNMSKEDKKAFKEKVRADFKEMKAKFKAAKKEKRQKAGQIGAMEVTGLVVALGGIAIAIVGAILSLGIIAGIGGLIFLIGAIVFILAFIDVI
ncbi:MAG: hypothetical protein AAF502_05500 [Bacteroidota bacterium]